MMNMIIYVSTTTTYMYHIIVYSPERESLDDVERNADSQCIFNHKNAQSAVDS